MNKGYKYLLMFGHLFTDINQGALPAILPFLIVERNLDFASAASLVLAANLVSSVVQPLFGYLGDKISRPWLMSLGVALAGGGVAAIGFCHSYWAAFAAAAVSGFGIALFHPEGGKIANFVSGEKKGSGISVFAVGGNLGFAAGPVIATAALSLWGLRGTAVLVVPALTMAGILLPYTARFKSLSPVNSETSETQTKYAQADDWGSFTKASTIVFGRSILFYGLSTFIPLFFIGTFGQTEAAANMNLTVFSITGAVATLIGGRIADRIGFRRTIRICCFIMVPTLLALLHTSNSFIAMLLVIPIGIAMNSQYSSLVAIGQSFVPNHIGFASGITLGLAVSVGGLCAPGIGWIGDRFGIMAAMYTITGIAVLTVLFTIILPQQRINHQDEPGKLVHNEG